MSKARHWCRPSYRFGTGLHAELSGTPFMAVAARAPRPLIEDIQEVLRCKNPATVAIFWGCRFRPNLNLRVVTNLYTSSQSYADLLHLLQSYTRQNQSSIVFVPRIKDAVALVSVLKDAISVDAYHAQLSVERKNAILSAWQQGRALVVVCTVAFGMGINKAYVHFVVHWSIMGTFSSYY